MRSRSRCSGAYEETFIRAAEQARPGAGWKAIVKTYLRPEFCEHPERGCPQAALAPELARADKGMKPQIVAELVNYKNQMLPFMPGRRTVDIKTTWSKSRLSVEVVHEPTKLRRTCIWHPLYTYVQRIYSGLGASVWPAQANGTSTKSAFFIQVKYFRIAR